MLNWNLKGKSLSMANWHPVWPLGLELEALKQRFWKHANPAAKQPRAGQKVIVNIVVKEVGTDGKEELKADVVPVTLAAEKLDGVSHAKPGIWVSFCLLCTLYSSRSLWPLKTLNSEELQNLFSWIFWQLNSSTSRMIHMYHCLDVWGG